MSNGQTAIEVKLNLVANLHGHLLYSASNTTFLSRNSNNVVSPFQWAAANGALRAGRGSGASGDLRRISGEAGAAEVLPLRFAGKDDILTLSEVVGRHSLHPRRELMSQRNVKTRATSEAFSECVGQEILANIASFSFFLSSFRQSTVLVICHCQLCVFLTRTGMVKKGWPQVAWSRPSQFCRRSKTNSVKSVNSTWMGDLNASFCGTSCKGSRRSFWDMSPLTPLFVTK